MIGIDDILAALIMSLSMLRRLEAKSAPNEGVDPVAFRSWQSQALSIYGKVAGMCLAKIVASQGWLSLAMATGVGGPWLQLGGAGIFMLWAVAMVLCWRRSTDVHHLRLALGIALRIGRCAAPIGKEPQTSTRARDRRAKSCLGCAPNPR